MSENYIVINGKRVELTEEQMKQLGIEVKRNRRWRAEKGGRYWLVTDRGTIAWCNEDDSNIADNRYYSHNYFQTNDEAYDYARVLETEMLLKTYADEHNEEFGDFKYYFFWSGTTDWARIDSVTSYAYRPRTIFFSSKEIIADAIKEIGADRIKEYLIYEWQVKK